MFFPLCKECVWFYYFTLYFQDSPDFTCFVAGVLTRGQLGLVDLILQYVHCDEVNEAINILSSMNWDTMGQQCFVSMSAIMNHLLRQRLTPEREGQTSVVLSVREIHFESVLEGLLLMLLETEEQKY